MNKILSHKKDLGIKIEDLIPGERLVSFYSAGLIAPQYPKILKDGCLITTSARVSLFYVIN